MRQTLARSLPVTSFTERLLAPADKILTLPREYKPAELAGVLKVPWDLLFAANPDGLVHLGAGRQISLGKDALYRHLASSCYSKRYRTHPGLTVCGNSGGRYQVQTGDTIWTIADELSQLGTKITPYDLLKYNVNLDPHFLKTGFILVVPIAPTGKCM